MLSPALATRADADDPQPSLQDALRAELYPRFVETKEEAERGDADAQVMLANFYKLGGVTPENPAEALKWYRKAAEQGHIEAQYEVAMMLGAGKGVSEDDVEAAKWFTKAANGGESYAQGRLAWMYFEGRGVPRDLVQAYRWLNLATAQGHDGAKEYLALVAEQMTPQQIAEAQKLSAE